MDIVSDFSIRLCKAFIRRIVNPERIIYSDQEYGYNGFVDMSCKKYYRIRHGNNEFARGKKHITKIELF